MNANVFPLPVGEMVSRSGVLASVISSGMAAICTSVGSLYPCTAKFSSRAELT